MPVPRRSSSTLRRHAVRARLATALTLPLALLVGCADDPHAAYCEKVEEHQQALTEQTAGDRPGAVFESLEIFRDLAAEAPDDIADEWQLVISRVERLEAALDDAGIDPATWDPSDRKGLPTEVKRAASELVAPDTTRALADLDQQALDVCKTPLRR